MYLTVSARASVSLLGSVEAQHIVMNWQRPKKVETSEGDWVGLFDVAVGAGDILNGEFVIFILVEISSGRYCLINLNLLRR